MSKNVNGHQVKNSKFRRKTGKPACFAYLVILVTLDGKSFRQHTCTDRRSLSVLTAGKGYQTKWSSSLTVPAAVLQLLTAIFVWSVAHALTSSYYRSTHDDRPAAVLIKTRHYSSFADPIEGERTKTHLELVTTAPAMLINQKPRRPTTHRLFLNPWNFLVFRSIK